MTQFYKPCIEVVSVAIGETAAGTYCDKLYDFFSEAVCSGTKANCEGLFVGFTEFFLKPILKRHVHAFNFTEVQELDPTFRATVVGVATGVTFFTLFLLYENRELVLKVPSNVMRWFYSSKKGTFPKKNK